MRKENTLRWRKLKSRHRNEERKNKASHKEVGGIGDWRRRRNVILYKIAGVKRAYFCFLGLLPCNLLLTFSSALSLWLKCTLSTVCSTVYIWSQFSLRWVIKSVGWKSVLKAFPLFSNSSPSFLLQLSFFFVITSSPPSRFHAPKSAFQGIRKKGKWSDAISYQREL